MEDIERLDRQARRHVPEVGLVQKDEEERNFTTVTAFLIPFVLSSIDA
jgi:hypothetical protein